MSFPPFLCIYDVFSTMDSLTNRSLLFLFFFFAAEVKNTPIFKRKNKETKRISAIDFSDQTLKTRREPKRVE